jgi:3-hydroxy-D-aspartate aldolase
LALAEWGRRPCHDHPPAEIGMTLDEVDTPALVIDLDAFERNLRRLADRVAGSGVNMRPHAKTHKCPVIGLKQMELGAVGVCCQKVGEAEALVYGGVKDVLVTNEIVGRQKLRRLTALAHNARIGVCVDDGGQVAALDAAARDAGITLPVYSRRQLLRRSFVALGQRWVPQA